MVLYEEEDTCALNYRKELHAHGEEAIVPVQGPPPHVCVCMCVCVYIYDIRIYII